MMKEEEEEEEEETEEEEEEKEEEDGMDCVCLFVFVLPEGPFCLVSMPTTASSTPARDSLH